MVGIFPSYGGRWEPLSEKHRELEDKLEAIIKEYSNSPVLNWPHWANAVVGVFGSGKAQFLYHVFKKALERGFYLYTSSQKTFSVSARFYFLDTPS